jgi:hypothetical protein
MLPHADLVYVPDGLPPLCPELILRFFTRLTEGEPQLTEEERVEAWSIYIGFLREMPYDFYLRSPLWQMMRQAAHDWWGSSCRTCGATDRLHVHHRTYERLGNELPDDLIILCADCHARIHKKERC